MVSPALLNRKVLSGFRGLHKKSNDRRDKPDGFGWSLLGDMEIEYLLFRPLSWHMSGLDFGRRAEFRTRTKTLAQGSLEIIKTRRGFIGIWIFFLADGKLLHDPLLSVPGSKTS